MEITYFSVATVYSRIVKSVTVVHVSDGIDKKKYYLECFKSSTSRYYIGPTRLQNVSGILHITFTLIEKKL